MSRGDDPYRLSPYVRARIAGKMTGWDRQGRRGRSSGPTVGEKCKRCRELRPFGYMENRLCNFCLAELVDAPPEEQRRWNF